MNARVNAAIIDDDPESVSSLITWLDDLDIDKFYMNPVQQDIEAIANEIRIKKMNLAIVDYQLHTKNYSHLNGVDIVHGLVKKGVPAILLTSYQPADMPDYVIKGRHIPYILNKSDIDDEHLPHAITAAQNHVMGNIMLENRPFPTLLRIEQVDKNDNIVYLKIPALHGDPGITMKLSHLEKFFNSNQLAENFRFEAQVNIAAKDRSKVFVDDPKPLPELLPDYEKLLHN